MKIRILTDSTCDLSAAFLKRHDIGVLPLTVSLNGVSYTDDGAEITPDDIFQAVANGAGLPKTSAINVTDYRRAFESALEGCDAVLHFAISEAFSSCHANAVLASEGLPVYCVDSRNLSCGIGLMVAEAADQIAAGADDPAAIAEHCRDMADRVDCSFLLDRLDYLHKGGRCSLATVMGASVLHLKPCIEVVDGSMVVGRKYRGSFERCLKLYVADRLHDPGALDPRRIFIAHTGISKERLAIMRAGVEEAGRFDEIIELRVGSTISSHCGENTCGLMFVKKHG